MQPSEYMLGTLGVTPLTFNLSAEIDQARYIELRTAMQTVSRLSHSFSLGLVERNFLDLASIHQFAGITMSLGRSFASPDHRMLTEAISTSVVNWLSSFGLFLDHARTDLSHRYGKESTQVAEFEIRTREVFDGHLGYRFTCKLRNYVLHCGFPSTHIALTRTHPGSATIQRASILMARDDLLDNFTNWGPVTADLRVMSGHFPLLPLVESAMTGLRAVSRFLIEVDLDAALQHLPVLTAAVAEIGLAPDGEVPAFFEMRGALGQKAQITPSMLPLDTIKSLEEVRTGTRSRDDILQTRRLQPPKFAPETVAARLHADGRGVQILTAWLAEGRATSHFLQALDDLVVADDGDIAPLIGGLTSVSGVLLHMLAATLGASPSGLLAGLLDVYGSYNEPEPVDYLPT